MLDSLDRMELTIGLRVTFRDGDTTREGLIVGIDRWAAGGLRVVVKTADLEFIDVGLDQLGAILSGDDGKPTA